MLKRRPRHGARSPGGAVVSAPGHALRPARRRRRPGDGASDRVSARPWPRPSARNPTGYAEPHGMTRTAGSVEARRPSRTDEGDDGERTGRRPPRHEFPRRARAVPGLRRRSGMTCSRRRHGHAVAGSRVRVDPSHDHGSRPLGPSGSDSRPRHGARTSSGRRLPPKGRLSRPVTTSSSIEGVGTGRALRDSAAGSAARWRPPPRRLPGTASSSTAWPRGRLSRWPCPTRAARPTRPSNAPRVRAGGARGGAVTRPGYRPCRDDIAGRTERRSSCGPHAPGEDVPSDRPEPSPAGRAAAIHRMSACGPVARERDDDLHRRPRSR
ncbi:hypothetical protein FHR81_000440 [Actinoalloteichus hoggarensis]|uniref:Uncharacterized protein n=1 Tax=Actinoalloteichus hoggarensis TaxID=1470176 RepID=A0A221W240_9PSEU|nr:hypothetical protein AHOG_11185 [Actinoalloteichus hoggarensis]MBB5919411.1 hypothetical protein [Actinoalloteichus hoggarensis]